MKIFVTIKPPREDNSLQTLAAQIETEIKTAGFIPFIASKELEKHGLTPGFMRFIEAHIRQSGLMLILYHHELRGGLIEEGMAYALGIPIWLAYHTDMKVSTTARECAATRIEYSSHKNLVSRLQQELTAFKETL
jgi:hypothetical protein